MMRFLFISLFLFFISACSDFNYSTNVDKKNFVQYFKPSQITVYQKSDLKNLDYEVIAAVDGSSCQQKANDLPASAREARTKARINAANMHANAIVFQTCLAIKPDKTCLSNIICYGRALDVTPKG
jgi:RcsF protein